MRSGTRFAPLFALPLLVAVVLQATADSPFDYVPDEAGAVVYVPSTDAVVAGINKFGKAIGVDEMATLTSKDVNDNMFTALEGLDTSKPMLFAIGPDGEDSMVIVCSLKDVDAWKKSGDVAEKDGRFTYTLEGDEWCAMLKGTVLVSARDADILADAGKSSGKFGKIFADAIKGLGDDQFLLLVDVEAFRTVIESGLVAADAGITVAMEMAASQAGDEAEMYTAFAKWAMAALKRLVGDAERVVVTGRLDGDGVRIRKQLAFKSGTVTEYLGKVGKIGKPLLRGLPDRPFMAAMAADWKTPADTPSISEDLLDVMAVAIKSDAKEKYAAFIAKARKTYRESTGYNAILASTPDGMSIAGTYFTPDPAAYRKLMIEGQEFAQGMIGMMNQGPMKMECKIGEEKLAGKDVTTVEYHFSSDDPDLEKMLTTMYGEKPTMFTADGPEGMVMTFGGGESARKILATSLDSSSKWLPGNARVKEAMGRISPDPQFVALVDLGEFLAFATRMAESMGAGMPEMKLGAPTSLVTASLYLDPKGVRAELWVPADPIKKIILMATSAMGEEAHPME